MERERKAWSNQIGRNHLIVSCLLLVGLSLWLYNKTIDQHQQSDLQTIWSLSNQTLENKKTLLIKQTSIYKIYRNKQDFIMLSTDLSKKLDFPSGKIKMHEKHPIYETSYKEANSVNISLTIFGDDEQQMNIVISRKTVGEQSINNAEIWQRETATKLKNVSLAPVWNIIIQGTLRKEVGVPLKFYQIIEKMVSADEVEKYQDSSTYSVTYYTPLIKNKIESGSRSINLQAAAHLVTGTDKWRTTLGTPLITIEY